MNQKVNEFNRKLTDIGISDANVNSLKKYAVSFIKKRYDQYQNSSAIEAPVSFEVFSELSLRAFITIVTDYKKQVFSLIDPMSSEAKALKIMNDSFADMHTKRANKEKLNQLLDAEIVKLIQAEKPLISLVKQEVLPNNLDDQEVREKNSQIVKETLRHVSGQIDLLILELNKKRDLLNKKNESQLKLKGHKLLALKSCLNGLECVKENISDIIQAKEKPLADINDLNTIKTRIDDIETNLTRAMDDPKIARGRFGRIADFFRAGLNLILGSKAVVYSSQVVVSRAKSSLSLYKQHISDVVDKLTPTHEAVNPKTPASKPAAKNSK